ncbi:hypothetical protein Snas_5410 [Stackebrandtia nassauensis DSM 44728]|uniref:Uncharacterized protein n=1 Tax=Stackebrandtia nassauensis (strain DSM 44728 / CIP 108903 / NRRL B-16338 / NBRC 102104 / LLR-40K-21) TaxID=446470 RepID=D3PV18_STANL|nr:hypothetical protein Snas_5410 [Stackebrandtia nassauensis DSM 44728]
MLAAPVPARHAAATQPPRNMWRFKLVRYEDVSGVSGTGVVAVGVVCSDGSAWMRWDSSDPSSAMFDNWRTIERKHGHRGATELQWIDMPPNTFLHHET